MKLMGLLMMCATTTILACLLNSWQAFMIAIFYEISNVLFWEVWKLYEADHN